MSQPDFAGWRVARFASQLQVACGAVPDSPAGDKAATLVREAVRTVEWQSLEMSEFAVARGILLAFLLKFAQCHNRVASVAVTLDAIASTAATGIPECVETFVRVISPCRCGLPRPPDPRVEQVLRLIRKRCSREPVRIDELARGVGVSRWHLERLTKQQTGMPIRNHVAGARLDVAQRLLREGRLSIKEVAAGAGYAHPNAFWRDFKRQHGISPRAWVALQAQRASS